MVEVLNFSRPDYCNSLWSELPQYRFNLKRVQNAACRYVFKTSKFHSMSPFSHDLQWLRNTKRTNFNMITITYFSTNEFFSMPDNIRDCKSDRNSATRLIILKVSTIFGKGPLAFSGT